ncbi:MAG TPA: ATP cone domain-containing protein [Candidatus Paceibacterota bacterium]|nr:ATP cone domain-containing protein [Candidatus Paceibacterota bacterium]
MTTKPKIKIIKANGEEELYSPEKFRSSLEKADISKKLIDAAQKEVEEKLHEGMTTNELYDIAHKFLENKNTSSAARYSLKKSIMQLGPAGY